MTDARHGTALAAIEPIGGAVGAPLEAMEQLRDRVMTALATLTDPRLTKWIQHASKPPTFEAYREFVTGVELHTTVNFEEGRPYFLRAAALDSTFTMPLLWAIMGHAPAADSIAEALNRRRDRLAPLDRHFLDYLTATDGVTQLEAIRRVVEIAPGSDYLKNAGGTALRLNRPREAIQFLLAADPESGWLRGWTPYWNTLTAAYHLLGEHDRELEAAREGRRLHPDEGATIYYETRALAALGRVEPILARAEGALAAGAHMLLAVSAGELYAHGHRGAASELLGRMIQLYRGRENGRFHLARALAMAGRLDESRPILEQLAAEDPGDVSVRVDLAVVAARRGDRERARQIYRWLEEHGPASPMYAAYQFRDRLGLPAWHYSYGLAQIAAALGEKARAVELLREAADRSLKRPLREFHANPYLEPVWDYPPFRELLRPKG
ncbi:MAG: tetratricopeptide repeat protein [Candidatus Methylomirabilia bacterium]